MLVFEGTFLDEVVTVKWHNGRIETKNVALSLEIKAMAHELEGQPVGFASLPYTFNDHLKDPVSTYYIIKQIVPDVEITEGELPTYEVDPDVVY